MPVTVQCGQCGKEQLVRPARALTYRFCSYSCRGEWRKTNWTGENSPFWTGGVREKNCQHCGVLFSIGKKQPITTFRKQKFCSKACADIGGIRFSGADNPRWTGGKSRNRGTLHYDWVDKVIARDGAVCQHCEATSPLCAHHIKSYKDFPELRYELSNGITLCEFCHWKLHAAQNENGMNSVNTQTGNAVGNTEPSIRRKPVEGVTTRGRAYRRWFGPCEMCGTPLSRRFSDVKNRAHICCNKRCAGKLRTQIRLSKAVIPSASFPHESEEIV